jgi:amino acid adenylation domain-containing protein
MIVKQVIHTLVEQSATAYPTRIAVRSAVGEITYSALNDAANRLSWRLQEHRGWTAGSIAALCLPAGIPYVAAMLGVMKAGGVFVPIDLTLPLRRLRVLGDMVRPSMALTNACDSTVWAEAMAGVPSMIVDLSGVHHENPPVAISGDDPSYVVFTSGSSGQPKAILGTHKGLSHFIHWELKEFGLAESVRVSQLSPSTFDVSLRDMLVPLATGGTLSIPSPETLSRIDSLLEFLDMEEITLMHCVPSLFRALLHELERRPSPKAMLLQLRHILLAGEPLYASDVRRWRAMFGDRTELVNLYGPSETTLAKAFHRIREVPREEGRMIPVGNPLPNTALLILRDGELCDPGEIGEIHIKTPFMSKGYYGDPQRTAKVFIQNPLTPNIADLIYRTGDLGRYRPDGSVELLGRQDSQVKVHGVRIELAEIEGCLLEHPFVDQAAVVAHATEDHETCLAAYYTSARTLSDAELRNHLQLTLPPSMHPAFFIQMDQLPLNLHGKVVRRALPRPADLLYRRRPYVQPSNEIEEALAAIWDEVLQIRRVSAVHAFVELGGDSLKAIRVLPRIAERFGVEVKLPELFPHGTIRQLSSLVAERCSRTQPAATSGD